MKLFLDCDQTLYRNNELVGEIRSRMVLFMTKVFPGKSFEEVTSIRAFYLKKYGTTLAGLMTHENIDPHDFLDFVHEVDQSKYLKSDIRLLEMLKSLEMPIYIASNAPRSHVLRVLDILGVSSVPKGIFGIEDFAFDGKPSPNSYKTMLDAANATPGESLIVDDYAINVKGAVQAGMKALVVGDEDEGFKPKIDDIYQLADFINSIGSRVQA